MSAPSRQWGRKHLTQRQLARSPYVPASPVKVTRADGSTAIEAPYSPHELRAIVKERDVPKEMRLRVMRRDRGTCRYCGTILLESEVEIDHVTPIAKGGSNAYGNLVTACGDCNGRKGVEVWRPQPIKHTSP